MSTHKNIDRICVVIIVLCLLLTLLFMNGKALGLQSASRTMGYEQTLFDTSKVHTINIIIDDWDSFISTCESETYSACTVVIDNEAVKNVAIRGKGNTSLSTVKTMGSERYSFKIEFDQYEDGKNYHGLDKLSLNNLIQDNTCMKDYLAYRLMGEFGVDAPLCSFAWITVNGEDWGLYLAVEGIEDSFLQRNYGRDTGELYKPDSMSFGGGGPGNGKDFNMEDFMNRDAEDSSSDSDSGFGSGALPEGFDPSRFGDGAPPEGFDFSGEPPEGFGPGQSGEQPPEGFDPSQFGGRPSEGTDPAGSGEDGGQPEGETGAGRRRGGFDFGGVFGGMGSTDVKLRYIDDDPDSYSNIFNNAKTDITKADRTRLIQALKKLTAYEDLEDVVDVDEVIRYFVVHNYVCNGDSYTGSIIHNYYLHESDGQLSMIPWDYNLAFGSFQGSDATDTVNDPIDTPMSVSDPDDRPMWGWIQSSGEYAEMYHAYFAEFLDTVDIQGIIDEACALIRPYVEKDPTAFCTLEEFEAGVETLRTFCALRTESVRGQLEGTIPSTDAGQREDSSSLVDASGITISAMGSMGGGGGGFGGGGFPSQGGSFPAGSAEDPGSGEDPAGGQAPGGFPGSGSGDTGNGEQSGGGQVFPGGGVPGQGGRPGSFPGSGSGDTGNGEQSGGGQVFPGGGFPGQGGGSVSPPDEAKGGPGQTGGAVSGSTWLLFGICIAVLLAGLLIALRYRRRR
ncbi:MAG: CotH kinase family protein [Oscillospiraceae bacterium]|nr:CotH kinase family protein [Oscillospiraceae bacterium]